MEFTTKDHETLGLMVAEHWSRLKNSMGFFCGACHEKKLPQDCAGVFPFIPKDRHKNKGFATYVICKPCTNKTPDQVYEGVATHLAKNGFFVR